MASKEILLLLGAILLLQGYSAAPYHNKESAVLAVEERLLLQKLYTTEDREIAALIFRNAKTALEKVLKNRKILDYESDLMNSKLAEIRTFVKDVKDFDKNGVRSEAKIRELTNQLNRIIRPSTETLEQTDIANSLNETGFEVYDTSVEAYLKTVIENFCSEVQKYFDRLDEAGKKDESAILAFLEAIKAESDAKLRYNLINEFLESFELDAFLW